MNWASFIVVNLQAERYSPNMKGITNPIVKASAVGNANIGKYLLIAFSMFYLTLFGEWTDGPYTLHVRLSAELMRQKVLAVDFGVLGGPTVDERTFDVVPRTGACGISRECRADVVLPLLRGHCGEQPLYRCLACGYIGVCRFDKGIVRLILVCESLKRSYEVHVGGHRCSAFVGRYNPLEEVESCTNISIAHVFVDAPIVLRTCAESLILFTGTSDVYGEHTEIFVPDRFNVVVGPCSVLVKNSLAVPKLCRCIISGLAREL